MLVDQGAHEHSHFLMSKLCFRQPAVDHLLCGRAARPAGRRHAQHVVGYFTLRLEGFAKLFGLREEVLPPLLDGTASELATTKKSKAWEEIRDGGAADPWCGRQRTRCQVFHDRLTGCRRDRASDRLLGDILLDNG